MNVEQVAYAAAYSIYNKVANGTVPGAIGQVYSKALVCPSVIRSRSIDAIADEIKKVLAAVAGDILTKVGGNTA